jgi:hypothetical protein
MTWTIYVCVGIPIPLKFDKLHYIIIAMSCMLTYDHADSFPIVVSMHPLFIVALCFFSDRTFRDDVSNDKFFGCSLTILPGKLSRPLSTYRGTYYLIVFMLSLILYASLMFRCFVRVTYPIHLFSPKAKLYTRHLLPITFCLLFELALRVIGTLRLFQVVLSYWVVGKFITCSTWYMRWIWIGDKLVIRCWR